MLGQLAHGPRVGFLSTRRHALKLEIFDEALPEFRREVVLAVMTERLVEMDLPGPLENFCIEEFEAAEQLHYGVLLYQGSLPVVRSGHKRLMRGRSVL